MADPLLLLHLPFDGHVNDVTGRHLCRYFKFKGGGIHYTEGVPVDFDCSTFKRPSMVGNSCIEFDHEHFVKVERKQDDFMLGATPKNPYNNYLIVSKSVEPNNNFAIDCWIFLYDLVDLQDLPTTRWRGICGTIPYLVYTSSYQYNPCAWGLVVDTVTGRLRMLGNHYGERDNYYDSSFSVPMREWTHIAVQAWKVPDVDNRRSVHMMWKNGVPDRSTAYQFADMAFGNHLRAWSAYWANAYGWPDLSYYLPIAVGISPYTNEMLNKILSWKHFEEFKRKFPDLKGVWGNFTHARLMGVISNLRIWLGSAFPCDGLEVGSFSPPRNPELPPPGSTTTTATTTTTTTITITTPLTTTTTTFTTTTTWTTTTVTLSTTTQLPLYRNVTVNGSVQVSHEYPEFPGTNAVNGDCLVPWRCDVRSGPPYWITYYWLNEEHAVDEYRLYLNSPGRPKTWELRGSSDGVDWYVLDEQVNIFQEGLWVGRIDNTAKFSQYQLFIKEIVDTTYAVTLNEIRLYENSKFYSPEDELNYVGYEFDDPKLVQMYMMYLGKEHAIDAWKFQGSLDGVFWDDLDISHMPNFSGWAKVELDNVKFYKFYRILVLKWSSCPLCTPGISELRFFRRP